MSFRHEHALSYDAELGASRGLFSGNPGQDEWAHQHVGETHALAVADALLKVSWDAVALTDDWQEGEALDHMRYGLGRRLKALWLSLRSIVDIIPPGRVAPLQSEEVDAVSRDLNVIYINLRGALDNLAWAVWSLSGEQLPKRSQIGLFTRALDKSEALHPLAETLAPFAGWADDLAARRDPAAHRIPLSVAPSMLTGDDVQLYRERHAEYMSAQRGANELLVQFGPLSPEWKEAQRVEDAALERLNSVGEFTPVFFHHYREGHFPVYPTVTNDLGALVVVCRQVLGFIVGLRTQREQPG